MRGFIASSDLEAVENGNQPRRFRMTLKAVMAQGTATYTCHSYKALSLY